MDLVALVSEEVNNMTTGMMFLTRLALSNVRPNRIIRSGPATVVIWEDGSKTVVKKHDGDKDDIHSAFCAAVAKRVYGSNSKLKSVLKNTEIINQR